VTLKESDKTSLEFFKVLNFVLTFCPTVPSEQDLMARFAKIGVGAGKAFDPDALKPELKEALAQGIADGWNEYLAFKSGEVDTGKVTSGALFGTRTELKNNYLYRMAAAIIGTDATTPAQPALPDPLEGIVGADLWYPQKQKFDPRRRPQKHERRRHALDPAPWMIGRGPGMVGLGPHDHEVARLGVECPRCIEADAIAAAGDQNHGPLVVEVAVGIAGHMNTARGEDVGDGNLPLARGNERRGMGGGDVACDRSHWAKKGTQLFSPHFSLGAKRAASPFSSFFLKR
jgi:hypothetical protein